MTMHSSLKTTTQYHRSMGADWEEEYAYSLGIQAYIWGFPWILLSQLAWLWTSPEGKVVMEKKGIPAPSASMNSFFNSSSLATPADQTGGSPNCDTLYSTAWLNLSAEPLVLSVPEVTDRFYSLQIACASSDNFAYVGLLATGSQAGNYLLALPNWQGQVPNDVHDILARSPTPVVFILGRTGVNNKTEADLDKAHKIQSGYRLTPLSRWVDPNLPPETPPKAIIPVGLDYSDPTGAWLTINRSMTQNSPIGLPGVNQEGLIDLFATIGVGPNQEVELQSRQTQLGLQRAAEDALNLLKSMAKGRGKQVNNWNYPPIDYGRAGYIGDYITRSALQALGGIVANDPNEAVYLNATIDSNGDELSSDKNYSIVFGSNGDTFPPIVSGFYGFWSLTMYGSDFNLVQGSDHYHINGSYPEYQELGADGTFKILIQATQPETQKGVYWLQTPDPAQAPNFYLILRVYIPDPEVSTTQTWKPPLIIPQP
jgi:hypothetical protein